MDLGKVAVANISERNGHGRQEASSQRICFPHLKGERTECLNPVDTLSSRSLAVGNLSNCFSLPLYGSCLRLCGVNCRSTPIRKGVTWTRNEDQTKGHRYLLFSRTLV